jgi:hypothetical protein
LEICVLVPSYKKLEEALDNKVKHMSFLTSCSNSFQKKNVNKTLAGTKEDLDKIFEVLKKPENQCIKKKLYVSCISECPIEGKINLDYILHEICDNNMAIYNDIMGTIRSDYNEIIGALKYELSILEIRQLIHKLVGVVLILEGKNYEIMYYLKMLLNIDKTETNIKYYQVYIKMITDYDESFLGL